MQLKMDDHNIFMKNVIHVLSVHFYCLLTTDTIMPNDQMVVFGHSYVRRAYFACEQHNLGLRHCDVHFITRSGGSIIPSDDRRSLPNMIGDVAWHRPNVVNVHAGENDMHLPPHEVVDRVKQLLESIQSRCHPSTIIISQFVLFSREAHRRDDVTWINAKLHEYVRRHNSRPTSTRLVFWKHRMGIWGPNRLELFSADGVHLNDQGRRRYLFSLRAAIGQVLHS
jgi:hypothetical protein